MLSNRSTQEILHSSARYGLVYDTNGTRMPSTLHGTERKSLPFYDLYCTCTYYVSRVLSIVRHHILSIVRPHMHMHMYTCEHSIKSDISQHLSKLVPWL